MSEEAEASGDESSPWGNIGWGLFLIAVGVGLYFYFGHLEQEGGSVRMNAIVLMVYNVAGKTGVLAVLGGIGGLLTFLGVKDLAGRSG